jgi:hypothetical protein
MASDFEEASQPRELTLTVGGLLRLFGTLASITLVVGVTVIACLVYNANQPRKLLLGRWQAVDHPEIHALEFYANDQVRILWKTHDPSAIPYHFASRWTVSMMIGDGADPDDHGLFRITFGNQARTMTTENKDTGETFSWRRL